MQRDKSPSEEPNPYMVSRERERAIDDLDNYPNTIKRIKQFLSTTPEKFRKQAQGYGLDMSPSTFQGVVGPTQNYKGRAEHLRRICRALNIEFEDNISHRRYGGYRFSDFSMLVGNYYMIRPCADRTEYISVYPTNISADSDYGCMRVASRDSEGDEHPGDISIAPGHDVMEISMLDRGYNFLAILQLDRSRRKPLRGMLMTLEQDELGRWIPMCLPIALLTRERIGEGEKAFLVGPDHDEYEDYASTLQTIVDLEFLKTVRHIKKAAG